MNRLFTFLIFFFGILSFTFSQIPQQFNFQGVARDNGAVITGTVSLQISIHQGTPAGPVVFRERHFPVTNNAGVFNVLVGQGMLVTGTISSIDWTNGPFFLQTELDPTGGLSFTDMGTTPFSSVPYALYAREAEIDAVQDADADPTNEIQQLSFNTVNNQLSISSGNTVTIPTGGTDADADPTNELQTLSQSGNLVSLSLGGGTINVDDADNNTNNELQSLSINGNQLTLSNGGGTISIDDADNNPNNELQSLSQNANLVSLSLGGGTININDADSNPGNELQNLSWNPAANLLGITTGNNVDLSSLAANPSPWKTDPFGLYYNQGDVYVGSPGSTPSLHLATTFIDFHTGMPYYSFYDPYQIAFTGETFSSKLTNNLVQIDGAIIDSYWNNRMDSTGFYADYWGLFPGQTVQDAYGFEARPDIGISSSYGRLQTDQLEIREMGVTARLDKNDLLFQIDGLGPYAQFSGNGVGYVYLYNGANWANVLLTGTNHGGDLQLYDPTGNLNAILGYDNSGNPNTGSLSLYDPNDNEYIYLGMVGSSGNGSGGLWSDGPNGALNTMITSYSSYPNHGWIGVMDAGGNQQAGMYVDGSGNGILFADGASGGVKSFVMQHPDRSDTDIWYASLEGPEAAAYERGVATLHNGTVFVPFSDHFRVVANTETMTVILTPHSIDTYGLAVVSKTETGFTVRELKGETGNFSFDWEAKCVRKGWESWQVEREHNSHHTGAKPNQSSRRENH